MSKKKFLNGTAKSKRPSFNVGMGSHELARWLLDQPDVKFKVKDGPDVWGTVEREPDTIQVAVRVV